MTERSTLDPLLANLPAREGHFLLESGYHADVWLTLDALFVNPSTVAPLVAALAERLKRHSVTGVCGPLLGGAFLAHALALALDVRFYYSEPASARPGLFTAEYGLSAELRCRVRGERVAVVDDVISAGSSVRATIATLTTAGASIVAVGALLVLGDAAVTHFAEKGIPIETLGRRDFTIWPPEECPLCRQGEALEDPRIAER